MLTRDAVVMLLELWDETVCAGFEMHRGKRKIKTMLEFDLYMMDKTVEHLNGNKLYFLDDVKSFWKADLHSLASLLSFI